MQGRSVQLPIVEQLIAVAHDAGGSFLAQQLFQLLHALCHAGRTLVRGMGIGGDDVDQSPLDELTQLFAELGFQQCSGVDLCIGTGGTPH